MALCVKVRKQLAEKIRKQLHERELLDYNYSPKVIGNFVFFPIKESVKGFNVVKIRLQKAKVRPRSIQEALKQMKIEPRGITKSFDLIGSIAIIDVPKKFAKYEKKIADAIFAVHKNVKTVVKKVGPIYGMYRLRKVKILKGQRKTETVHRESGCLFKLDVTKAYFSPRLVFERQRIANLVKPGEKIFVPFAGVGPFPIVIAKKVPSAIVYANELNPWAWRYLKQNIKLNGTQNVIPFFGDARKIAQKLREEGEKFDRIIMPLPMGAEKFLDIVFALAKKGTVAHVYLFVMSQGEAIRIIEDFSKRMNKKIEILTTRKTREYSPKIIETVVDFKIL